MPTSIPLATYRLQFHRDFNFRRATEILPYLRKLGISHLYSSPYFQASASSQHGYDVADHNQLNPAVGSEADFATLVADLRRLGMGQVLDFVPNHMGISEPLNRWWMDVLENGPSSLFASHFDIEWQPIKEELENKVLLPILGDRYGRVLEKGEFRLSIASGAFYVHYYETKLPLNPRSYPLILEKVAGILGEDEEREYFQELLSIINSMGSLPQRSHTRPDAIRLRAREKEVGKRRLARLLETVSQVGKQWKPSCANWRAGKACPRASTRWTNCWNGRSTASATGVSRPRRLTTAGSSTSTLSPRFAWKCLRSSRRRTSSSSKWLPGAR
jgi:(1->4)-alpha-D-glucan 1-alpha-D-glucosylmutase